MVPGPGRGRLHRGVALASRPAPLVGTGTPRAGSSSSRWTSGTHALRSWSFQESHPVPESTAVTSAASCCKPSPSPRYPSRGRSGNSRRRCRSTSPNSPASCESPAPRFTIGSMAASPTPITGPGFGRCCGWCRNPGSRRPTRSVLPAAGPPWSTGRGVPAWTTPPAHRKQGPHGGRRTPRNDGGPHRSKRPGPFASSRSHGRRAEVLTQGGGGRTGHPDRHGPLRRGDIRP